MSAQAFHDLDAFSRHQAQRELDEAVRVHGMSAEVFSRWLEDNLAPLQGLASAAFEGDAGVITPHARCFRTPAEKNRHDEEQEIERAVRLALHRLNHVR